MGNFLLGAFSLLLTKIPGYAFVADGSRVRFIRKGRHPSLLRTELHVRCTRDTGWFHFLFNTQTTGICHLPHVAHGLHGAVLSLLQSGIPYVFCAALSRSVTITVWTKLRGATSASAIAALDTGEGKPVPGQQWQQLKAHFQPQDALSHGWAGVALVFTGPVHVTSVA